MAYKCRVQGRTIFALRYRNGNAWRVTFGEMEVKVSSQRGLLILPGEWPMKKNIQSPGKEYRVQSAEITILFPESKIFTRMLESQNDFFINQDPWIRTYLRT